MKDHSRNRPLLLESLEHRIAMATDIVSFSFSFYTPNNEFHSWFFKDTARSNDQPTRSLPGRSKAEGEGRDADHANVPASNAPNPARTAEPPKVTTVPSTTASATVTPQSNASRNSLLGSTSKPSNPGTTATTITPLVSGNANVVLSSTSQRPALPDRMVIPSLAPAVPQSGLDTSSKSPTGSNANYHESPLSKSNSIVRSTADVGGYTERTQSNPLSSISRELFATTSSRPRLEEMTKVLSLTETQEARSKRMSTPPAVVSNSHTDHVTPEMVEALLRHISTDEGFAELVNTSPNPSLQPMLGTLDWPLTTFLSEQGSQASASHRDAVLAVVHEWESHRPPQDPSVGKTESTTWTAASSIAAIVYVAFLFKKRQSPAGLEATKRVRRPRKPR